MRLAGKLFLTGVILIVAGVSVFSASADVHGERAGAAICALGVSSMLVGVWLE